MSNPYQCIGYIGLTDEASALAEAVAASTKLEREQYVWSASVLPTDAANVTALELDDFAAKCMIFVFTDGSDIAALEQLSTKINKCAVCLDLSRALPTEKYLRAKQWENAGGYYADGAYEGTIREMLSHGTVYFSGNGSFMAFKAFQRVLFPIFLEKEAGEATLLRLLRTTPASTLSELLPYVDYYHKTCPAPQLPELVADQPGCEGVANVLKRAKQWTDVVWQPLKKFPKVIGLNETDDFSAEFPIIGMPYSSTRMEERFVGTNLSEETFFTALENENSVLYTRDIRAHGNAAAYYGTVCSVFVGNSIALQTRVPCKLWPMIPGMHLIEPNTVDSLKLGDTLLNATHVAIVTGIDRTSDGKVYQVHVSESTHPRCLCRVWRADIFTEYWLNISGFKIYRYDGVKDAVYTQNPYITLEGEQPLPAKRNGDIALNFGNKANCRLGELVEFFILSEGWKILRIEKNGEPVMAMEMLGEPCTLRYLADSCGYYRVYCVKEGGIISDAVEFAVVSCSIETDKDAYRVGEAIQVFGHDMSGAKPECAFLVYDGVLNHHVRETQHIQWFTPEEQEAGRGIVSYNVPGPYILKVFFRNKYGVYGSDYVKLEIR